MRASRPNVYELHKLLLNLQNYSQIPPHVLEYEQRTFHRDIHVRFHTSKSDSNQIRTYLWPALLEGPKGTCVHKAVVIT